MWWAALTLKTASTKRSMVSQRRGARRFEAKIFDPCAGPEHDVRRQGETSHWAARSFQFARKAWTPKWRSTAPTPISMSPRGTASTSTPSRSIRRRDLSVPPTMRLPPTTASTSLAITTRAIRGQGPSWPHCPHPRTIGPWTTPRPSNWTTILQSMHPTHACSWHLPIRLGRTWTYCGGGMAATSPEHCANGLLPLDVPDHQGAMLDEFEKAAGEVQAQEKFEAWHKTIVSENAFPSFWPTQIHLGGTMSAQKMLKRPLTSWPSHGQPHKKTASVRWGTTLRSGNTDACMPSFTSMR